MPNTNNAVTDQSGGYNRTIADDARIGAQDRAQPTTGGGLGATAGGAAAGVPAPKTAPVTGGGDHSHTSGSVGNGSVLSDWWNRNFGSGKTGSVDAVSGAAPAGAAPAGGQQDSILAKWGAWLRDNSNAAYEARDRESGGRDIDWRALAGDFLKSLVQGSAGFETPSGPGVDYPSGRSLLGDRSGKEDSTTPSYMPTQEDIDAFLNQYGIDGSNPYGTNPYGGGSTGGGGSSSGGGSNGAGYSNEELLRQALNQAGIWAPGDPYQLPEIMRSNPDKLKHISTDELKSMLQQIVDAQTAQANGQIDYGVQQGINELTRAMEDAAGQYQTQRNQIAADELRALDNQALYAEARGDRGGIGQAQYGAIQATAAQNRRAVNDAQVKLSTDTARQISDLRSQGEFQKADQLLSITQSYLSQLMNLEQWALETNLGVDQFNIELEKWMDEYNLNVQQFLTDLDLSAAQLTGVFANGQQTLAAKNQLRDSLASSGSALLNAGVLPSRQQLEAMGMTEKQAKAYLNKTAE